MRWMVLVWLVTGCEAPELAVFGEVDGSDLLVDDPMGEFAERVRTVDKTAARLLPDGPILTGARDEVWMPLPVVDPSPWPRVSIDAQGVRLLLYLDRSSLESRVVARADGTGAFGEGRVLLPLGLPVEVTSREDERVLATIRLHLATVETWMPRFAVDEVWREDDTALSIAWPDVEGESRSILGGTELLDRPGGEPLARLEGDPDQALLMLTVTGEPKRAYLPVVLDYEGVRIEGWAHEDDLTDNSAGYGCSCGGGMSHCGFSRSWFSPSAIVPAGTLLRASLDGPVVALVLEDLPVPVAAREEGAEIMRQTPFGSVTLWADPQDVL